MHKKQAVGTWDSPIALRMLLARELHEQQHALAALHLTEESDGNKYSRFSPLRPHYLPSGPHQWAGCRRGRKDRGHMCPLVFVNLLQTTVT